MTASIDRGRRYDRLKLLLQSGKSEIRLLAHAPSPGRASCAAMGRRPCSRRSRAVARRSRRRVRSRRASPRTQMRRPYRSSPPAARSASASASLRERAGAPRANERQRHGGLSTHADHRPREHVPALDHVGHGNVARSGRSRTGESARTSRAAAAARAPLGPPARAAPPPPERRRRPARSAIAPTARKTPGPRLPRNPAVTGAKRSGNVCAAAGLSPSRNARHRATTRPRPNRLPLIAARAS